MSRNTIKGLTYISAHEFVEERERPIKPSEWNSNFDVDKTPYEELDPWAQYEWKKKYNKKMEIYRIYKEDRKKRKLQGDEFDLSGSEDEDGN